jgi:hypothetical protein
MEQSDMSVFGGPDIITDGLVLHLDAANRKSYPGSGSTWYDLSGGDNHCTLNNIVSYNMSSSFSFWYTNPSTVTVPLANTLNKVEGTMNFWLYPSRYYGGNGYFVNRDSASQNANDWFWIGPYGGTFYFRLGNGSSCCSQDLTFNANTYIPLNNWVNMCFTWKEDATSKAYKNGVLIASKNIGNIPDTNPTTTGRIGVGHGYFDTYFNGQMAHVSMYETQLSADKILSNYNALKGRYGL